MAREIRRIQPDFVLLQECFVCRDTKDDTARRIASEMDMGYVFASARRKVRRHGGEDRQTESGLAILARTDLQERRSVPLPSTEVGGERIALVANAKVAGAQLRLGCVHFSHIRSEVGVRRRQIEASLEAVMSGSIDALGVLGGDFNCEAESAEVLEAIERGPGRARMALTSLGVREATSPLPPRPDRPGRQIDQIWLGESGCGYRIADGGVALNEPLGESSLYPSDHAAVWVDLALGASPQSRKP